MAEAATPWGASIEVPGRALPRQAGADPSRRASRRQDSWPLWQQGRHFELGHVLNGAVTDLLEPPRVGSLTVHHAGLWECEVSTSSLIWSGGVHDIFGLCRGTKITRDAALACYTAESREILERLRAHAILNQLGFTVDVEIRAAAVRERRWVRVIAAPVIKGEAVTHLHGVKLII